METINATVGHEEKFRAAWRLIEAVKGDPYWELAYDHAAKYKLTTSEIQIIGTVLIRNSTPAGTETAQGQQEHGDAADSQLDKTADNEGGE